MAVFNQQPTLTGRRIYLTFISLVAYFIPFLLLVLCYACIFIKLLWREHDQKRVMRAHPARDFSSLLCPTLASVPMAMFEQKDQRRRSAPTRLSFSEYDARRKRANAYAKARTKTFRMVRHNYHYLVNL